MARKYLPLSGPLPGREYIWGYHSHKPGLTWTGTCTTTTLRPRATSTPEPSGATARPCGCRTLSTAKSTPTTCGCPATPTFAPSPWTANKFREWSPDVTEHVYRVVNLKRRVTLAATARHPKSTVSIGALDADGNAEGHQVDLRVGGNSVTISVTAPDGTITTHALTINRASSAITGWAVMPDVEDVTGSGSESPGGIWSDGTYIWASSVDHLRLYAYGPGDWRTPSRPGHQPALRQQ